MCLFQGKLNPIQNSDQMVENLSNMCLENSLTIECHSSSINDKIDETSLMSQESSFTGKRSNYETNSEHIKKKKKIIPTSHAIDNVSNNKVNFIFLKKKRLKKLITFAIILDNKLIAF